MIHKFGNTCANYTLEAKQYIATPEAKFKLLKGILLGDHMLGSSTPLLGVFRVYPQGDGATQRH